jgi:hypothetical protein
MLEPKRNCHFLATLCAGILAAVASQLAGADVIAQWHFDEAPGETLAHDSVGAHDGALSGSAAFVEGGVSGNPISVTRSGDGFVNMGDIFPFTSGDFSIVVWARVSPGDLTPDSMFAAKHRSTIVSGHFLCMNHPWGTPGKATFYQGSAWVNSFTDVNDGAWHQIVGVHHATGLHEIYVDGAPVENAVPSTPMYGIDAPFLVGGLDFGGVPQGVLDGLVDEVQVYDCALTDAQVQYLLEHPAEAVATIVYFNDFESGAGPEWSNTTTDITPVGARRFLGQFGNHLTGKRLLLATCL